MSRKQRSGWGIVKEPGDMFNDLPDEINAALDLLWNYADDASAQNINKDDLKADGYECKEKSAHQVIFILSRKI